MLYFVWQEFVLEAFLLSSNDESNDHKSKIGRELMMDIILTNTDTYTPSPYACRLLPLVMMVTNSNDICTTLENIAKQLLSKMSNHFTSRTKQQSTTTAKMTSAFLVAAYRILQEHPPQEVLMLSLPNLISLMETVLSSSSSSTSSKKHGCNNNNDSLVQYQALQLLLWLRLVCYRENKSKEEAYGTLLEKVYSTAALSCCPLTRILWIRYTHGQLVEGNKTGTGTSSRTFTTTNYESFLESQLHSSPSSSSMDMVSLEAARVIIDCSSVLSTTLLETTTAMLQSCSLQRRRVKPVVQREANRLMELVGIQFLQRLGIST